jgi:hypothetical protein
MLANADTNVLITLNIFFVRRAIRANQDSTGSAVVLATEDSKELCADLAGIKALVRYPLCGFRGVQ